MGTISSGIGLISGLDIQSIVNQLMAIEARPRNMLLTRVANVDAQKAAFLDISARLTGMLGRIESLTKRSFFEGATANSSHPDILGASVASGAAPGAYSFIVRSLASTHQLVSGGFASTDATLTPGTLSIESAQARVDRRTELSALNGNAGVRRGRFEIVDGDGRSATININDAITLADVIDKINAADTEVRASLRGDGIVLTEQNGGTLRVREVDGGRTAADLGFRAGNTTATGTLTGSDLMYLSDGTPLSALNDGNGIRRAVAGGDFTIAGSATFDVDLSGLLLDTTRLERLNHGNGVELGRIRVTTKDGNSAELDLSGAQTVGDVRNAIAGAVDGISIVTASHRLVLSDTTQGEGQFMIEDLDGGTAARDLGIANSTDGTTINGRDILTVGSLRDVLNAINYANGNDGSVVAALAADGQRIEINDNGGAALTLTAINGRQALFDLGLSDSPYDSAQATGRRLIGGVNTVLLSTLNGGAGIETGTIQIDAGGNSVTVDLSAAETLDDIVSGINDAAGDLGIEAAVDRTGTRIVLRNTDGGSSTIGVSDVNGTLAASLGIDQSGSELRGANLQRQYISENTLLSKLNAGRGVTLGDIKITDSTGLSVSVALAGDVRTLGDVIDEINEQAAQRAVGVTASINETGDGLLLVDTAGGGLDLTVAEEGGTLARDLNILGSSDTGRIDGSYEFNIEVAATDTLVDVVDRINETTLADAALFSDGSDTAPHRLSITSRALGRIGELTIDGSAVGVDFTTLTRAKDAAVLLGDSADGGVLITSSSNTIAGVIDGVTINLAGVDDQPVTVTVDRDLGGLATALSGIVNDFNGLVDRIDELAGYDAESETAGLLLGDGTVRLIQSRLYRMVAGSVPGATGNLKRLADVGITLVSGARLSFDEQKFREAYEANPEEVIQFFTAEGTGVANVLKGQVAALTDDGGLLERRDDALEARKQLLTDRADQLAELLARKRDRLTRQFQAMESALAGLQSQQTALASLAALAST